MFRPIVFIAGLVTLITNSALFIFIASNRNLRLLSHVLLQSMLVNGFIWGLYVVIRFIGTYSYVTNVLCIILPRLGQAIFISLNLHSCVIMSERYFAIAYPFRYSRFVSVTNLSIICGLVWLLPITVPLISIIDGIYTDRLSNCSVADVQQFVQIDFYCHLIMLLIAALLLALLLTIYGRIIYLVKLRQHRVLGFVSRGQSANTTPVNVEDDHLLPKSKLMVRKKAVIQAIIVFTFYAIFLIPFLILTVIMLSNLQYYMLFLSTATLVIRDIAFCYPALQPLIYAYFTADIRHQICVVYFRIIRSAGFYRKSPKSATRLSAFRHPSDIRLPMNISND